MGALPPAGWYPDTTRPDLQRYWDGAQWTAQTAPRTAPLTVADRPPLATFGQRLGAYLLDALLLSVPLTALFIGFFGVFVAGSAATLETLDQADPTVGGGFLAGFLGLFMLVLLLSLVVPLLYAVGYEGSPQGQTFGKWVVGIRVVDGRTAGRLAPSRALIRALVRSFASQFLALGYLWMLWDEQSRTWHDLAADSRVVVTRGARPSFGQWLRSWTLRT